MENNLLTESNEETKKIDITDPRLREREVVHGLRFSRFVCEFERNEIIALYHSLTHQVIYLDKENSKKFKEEVGNPKNRFGEQEKPYIKKMIKKGFLVSLKYKEDEILREIQEKATGKPAFGLLYLLLTDMCNIRCRYCFIEQAMPSNRSFSMMDKETAVGGIDFFAKVMARNPEDLKIDRPTIIFYGGEPLLNKEVFIAAVNEIERLKHNSVLPERTRVTLITNGTILDQEIIDTIVERGVWVSVSLDGSEKLQDANRIFADRKGTFQTVYANTKRLKEAGVKVAISCTVSQANVDHLEEVLEWLISEFQIEGLGFNLLLDLPGVKQTNEAYVQKVTEKLIKCYQISRQKGVYEDRIMRKMKAFVKKYLHLVDCGGCGNQIVITPKGEIGPCQAYISSGKLFPGNLDNPDFDPFTDSIFLEWSRRSPFNIKDCYYCNAIGLCGGGCPYNAELKTGSIWKIDNNFCYHTKKILEWIIWELFEKTQNKTQEKLFEAF